MLIGTIFAGGSLRLTPKSSTMARSALALALLAGVAAYAGAESNAGRNTGPYVISVDTSSGKAASQVWLTHVPRSWCGFCLPTAVRMQARWRTLCCLLLKLTRWCWCAGGVSARPSPAFCRYVPQLVLETSLFRACASAPALLCCRRPIA